MKKHGFDVTALAVSGEEALQIAEEENPDLVLMDIILKGEMDGIITADNIREQYGIPVIFLTAYSDEKFLQGSKLTEPFEYITKPFNVKQLCMSIEIALYKSKIEKEKEKLIQKLQKEITERKKIEEELKELNENLSVTLDSIGDAVIVTGIEGCGNRINPVAEKLCGWKLEKA